LREQQRVSKETNDKYIKYKDFLNKTFKSHVRELYDDYEDLLGRDKSHSSSSKTNSTSAASNTKASESTKASATPANVTASKNVEDAETVEDVTKNQLSNAENANPNAQSDLAENGYDQESENVENGDTNGIDSVADANKDMVEEETAVAV
jgi:hypothetical protein